MHLRQIYQAKLYIMSAIMSSEVVIPKGKQLQLLVRMWLGYRNVVG